MSEFGFTNDSKDFIEVCKWKHAAIKDGWSIEPTYQIEDVSSAATLHKDGFTASIYTRRNIGKWRYEANVSVWGPDGLAIIVPRMYNWKEIKRATRRCNYCKAENVNTKRVGFAGRCCDNCHPTLKPKIEYPGWDN